MSRQPPSAESTSSRIQIFAALGALFVLYLALFLHYRPYDIDNPWFLSFSYYHHVEHIRTDEFFRMRFPFGMDGTQFFGSVAADLQAGVASVFGWQQRPMSVLSSAMVAAALGLWAWSLRRMGYGTRLVLTFLVAFGTSEPCVSAANRFRYEPLSFLLTAAGLLLSTFDLSFLSILVAALAVETQPSALLGLVPVLVFNLSRQGISMKLAARATLALMLAAAFTLALHPQLWHLVRYGSSVAGTVPVSFIKADHSGFVAYFLMARHIPETLFVAVTPWVFLLLRRKFPKQALWITWSALGAAILAILSPHPNVIYTLFFYPLLLLLALLWFNDRQLPWVAAAFLVSATAQYVYLIHLNDGQGYRSDDIAQVRSMIERGEKTAGLDDSRANLFGDYTVWYAHPHNFVGASENNAYYAPQADLLLCYRQHPPGASKPQSMLDCDAMLRHLPNYKNLESTTIRGNTLFLYTTRRSHR